MLGNMYKLLGAKVEFSTEYLVVAQNPSGRNLNVPLYKFKSTLPGPKVYIQSSIHGDESNLYYFFIFVLKEGDILARVLNIEALAMISSCPHL